MTNATRIAVAASALAALAAVACTAAPDETLSVEVQQGEVDPNCVKGGGLCQPIGTATGGTALGGFTSSGGAVLDPGTSSGGTTTAPLVPPKGDEPIDCGACTYKDAGRYNMSGCQCSGGGFGLSATIQCPYTYPCAYYVWGAYRCYARNPYTNQCDQY